MTRRLGQPSPHQPRAAFTLTEMLIATGLVVLIMVMFAQIYGSTFGLISDQRGLANNDQKARVVTMLLRSDLQNMTYRQPDRDHGDVQGIVPIAPGDEGGVLDPVRQRGYFYISENEPDNDSDDVLQFTTMISNAASLSQPYLGRAANLDTMLAPPPNPPLATPGLNEPDRDDGIDNDGVTQSRAAEVSYFVRGGNLYRRVLLLRDPLTSSPIWDDQPRDPTSTASQLFRGDSPVTRNYFRSIDSTNRAAIPDNDLLPPNAMFWQDFDYAATRVFDDPQDANGDLQTSYLWFHGLSSLDNHRGLANHPIALPWHRFGHLNDQRRDGSGNLLNPTDHGMPNEYINGYFIGRYTHEETSHPAFLWPGYEDPRPAGQNAKFREFRRRPDLPFVIPPAERPIYNPLAHVVETYAGGPRAGEDILLTNVEGFNIEVWDSNYDSNGDGIPEPQFVNLGHPLRGSLARVGLNRAPAVSIAYPSSDYDHQRNRQKGYGGRLPFIGADGAYGQVSIDDDGDGTTDNDTEWGWPGTDDIINRIYDTSHPSQQELPPFLPWKVVPAQGPLGFPAGDFRNAAGTQWAPNWPYIYGTVHFPFTHEDQNFSGGIPDASEDLGPPHTPPFNRQLDPGEDVNGNGQLDPGEDTLSQPGVLNEMRNYSYYYTVIRPGASRSRKPEFTFLPGNIVREADVDLNGDGIINPDTDDNSNGRIDSQEIRGEQGAHWQCFDNRIGLKAVRVTVRYKDVQSNQPRQVTIIHSFVE